MLLFRQLWKLIVYSLVSDRGRTTADEVWDRAKNRWSEHTRRRHEEELEKKVDEWLGRT